jgi:hypothetical protein
MTPEREKGKHMKKKAKAISVSKGRRKHNGGAA